MSGERRKGIKRREGDVKTDGKGLSQIRLRYDTIESLTWTQLLSVDIQGSTTQAVYRDVLNSSRLYVRQPQLL